MGPGTPSLWIQLRLVVIQTSKRAEGRRDDGFVCHVNAPTNSGKHVHETSYQKEVVIVEGASSFPFQGRGPLKFACKISACDSSDCQPDSARTPELAARTVLPTTQVPCTNHAVHHLHAQMQQHAQLDGMASQPHGCMPRRRCFQTPIPVFAA